MSEWRALDWFHLKGRGWVAVCSPSEPTTLGQARALRGRRVRIDGAEYAVLGVETFALGDEAPARQVGFHIEGERRPTIA